MKKLSILVVDDDPVIRRLLQQRLAKEDHDVTTADDGCHAQSILQKRSFHVILTDLMMPNEIGGIELLERAKNMHPKTEVILITAHSSIDTAVEAMKKGAADYLEKPINFDELFIRLEKISNLKEIMDSASDIQQAKSVTENEAARTIQHLEMTIAETREKIDEIKTILLNENLTRDLRITRILDLINRK